MKKIILLLLLTVFLTGCGGVQEAPDITSVGIHPDTTFKTNTNITNVSFNHGNLPVINTVHQMTHEGNAFHFGDNFTMNSNDIVRFMGCTQNKTVHFREFLLTTSGSPIFLEFFENTTFSSNGTLIGLGHNRNRQLKSFIISDLILFANPTVIDDGARLFPRAIYGAQQKIGGETSVPIEWILALNTCYTFKITNQNGNNVNVVANFFWYETN